MLKRTSAHSLNLRTGNATAPVLEGYGFDYEVSEDGVYGKERFAPDIKVDFSKKCFLLRDHDRGKVLGRRGKNLIIEKDKTGLSFKVDSLPDTALAKETRELIKQELMTDVSIGFLEIDSEVKDNIRTFKHIELCELSILPWGYHEGAQVSARANEKIYYPPECLT